MTGAPTRIAKPTMPLDLDPQEHALSVGSVTPALLRPAEELAPAGARVSCRRRLVDHAVAAVGGPWRAVRDPDVAGGFGRSFGSRQSA
jgi:hypothetical protein